jgi:hypothetical protein
MNERYGNGKNNICDIYVSSDKGASRPGDRALMMDVQAVTAQV